MRGGMKNWKDRAGGWFIVQMTVGGGRGMDSKNYLGGGGHSTNDREGGMDSKNDREGGDT